MASKRLAEKPQTMLVYRIFEIDEKVKEWVFGVDVSRRLFHLSFSGCRETKQSSTDCSAKATPSSSTHNIIQVLQLWVFVPTYLLATV